MTILKSLETARKCYGLKKENYWIYINKKTGEAIFKNEECKEPYCIGFFVEDDSRLQSIINIMSSRIKTSKYSFEY